MSKVTQRRGGMPAGDRRIRGRMRLTVRTAAGVLVGTRSAENMVLRKGGAIVAGLFAGTSTVPINQVQVGFAEASGTAELIALTPPKVAVPLAALRSPLKPENFTIKTDQPNVIEVNISAVFHPTVDLENVTEAGLLAGEDLYNQVVFEPISLHAGLDITFFWQVSFPFGH